MNSASPSKPEPAAVCMPVALPPEQRWDAYLTATRINPANAPMFAASGDAPLLSPAEIAAIATKLWRSPMTITVGWLDNPNAATRNLIFSHMKVWSEFANLDIVESAQDPMIRVARSPGGGYWSFLGTDCLQIPRGQATMNLAGFTERTSDAEYRRVVRHEMGHALGFPHEQQRSAIIRRLNREACYRYFGGSPNFWPRQLVDQNILTPIDESTLVGSDAEEQSIMCYQFGADLTVDGRAIPGGSDITERDKQTVAKLYGGRIELPPPPPPPPPEGLGLVPDGPAIANRIERRGEIDEFPLNITQTGRYSVSTQPNLIITLSRIDDDPRTPVIAAVGIRRPAVAQLEPGTYRATVIHRTAAGTGPYEIRCRTT